MGGNGSYSKGWGSVPTCKRTHTETNYRIEGHKVVYFTENGEQRKNILNSNSSDATYIIGTKQPDGTIQVHSVNVFNRHDLAYEINLEFDSKGNVIPFNNGKGSHAHTWQKDSSDGKLKRKSHDKKNSFPIDSKYNSLISKIETFNKQKKK